MPNRRHFTLLELLRSDTAASRGISNIPTADHQHNLEDVLIPGLEEIRKVLRSPMIITSGYRSPELNRIISGSSKTSHHMEGYAADFFAKFKTAYETADAIVESALDFDQLILYADRVHISFHPKKRRMVLTKLPTKYAPGLRKL